MTGTPLLDAAHLARSYRIADRPHPAVHDASLTVHAGDLISVVGHSGSGKSTFLAMAGGILRPDAGQVHLNRTDLWGLDDASRSRALNIGIGFVFQFASLVPTLTAEENVLLPSLFGGTATVADAERLLEMVGIADRLGRYPRELSGGEQQRVAVARALINAPAIILADEPTGNLDEATEASVMTVLERYVRENGAAMVMVTHNRELASRAGRRCVMKNGLLEELR